MPGNDHRIMDDYKKDWPKETRENPDGSPVLVAATFLRCVYDWIVIIAKRYLAPVFLWLEALEKRMRDLHGPRWWEKLGLPDLFAFRGVEL